MPESLPDLYEHRPTFGFVVVPGGDAFRGWGGFAGVPGVILVSEQGTETVDSAVNNVVHELLHVERGRLSTLLFQTDPEHTQITREGFQEQSRYFSEFGDRFPSALLRGPQCQK